MKNYLNYSNGAKINDSNKNETNIILEENDKVLNISFSKSPYEIIFDLTNLIERPSILNVFGLKIPKFSSKIPKYIELQFSINGKDFYFWGRFEISKFENIQYFDIEDVDQKYKFFKIIIHRNLNDNFEVINFFLCENKKNDKNDQIFQKQDNILQQTKNQLAISLKEMEQEIANFKVNKENNLENLKNDIDQKKHNFKQIDEELDNINKKNQEIIDKMNEIGSEFKNSRKYKNENYDKEIELGEILDSKIKNFISTIFEKQAAITKHNENLGNYLVYLEGIEANLIEIVNPSQKSIKSNEDLSLKINEFLGCEFTTMETKITKKLKRFKKKMKRMITKEFDSEIEESKEEKKTINLNTQNKKSKKNEKVLDLLQTLQMKMTLKKKKLQELKEISNTSLSLMDLKNQQY